MLRIVNQKHGVIEDNKFSFLIIGEREMANLNYKNQYDDVTYSANISQDRDGIIAVTFRSRSSGQSITIYGLDSMMIAQLQSEMEDLEIGNENYWEEYDRTGIPEDTPDITDQYGDDPMLTEF